MKRMSLSRVSLLFLIVIDVCISTFNCRAKSFYGSRRKSFENFSNFKTNQCAVLFMNNIQGRKRVLSFFLFPSLFVSLFLFFFRVTSSIFAYPRRTARLLVRALEQGCRGIRRCRVERIKTSRKQVRLDPPGKFKRTFYRVVITRLRVARASLDDIAELFS